MCFIYLFTSRYDGPEEYSAMMDEDHDHVDIGVGVVVVDGMAELGMGPSAGSASGGSISGKRKR